MVQRKKLAVYTVWIVVLGLENRINDEFNSVKQKIASQISKSSNSDLFQSDNRCSAQDKTIYQTEKDSEVASVVDLCSPEDDEMQNEVSFSLDLMKPMLESKEKKIKKETPAANISVLKHKSSQKKKKSVSPADKYSPLMEVSVSDSNLKQKENKNNCKLKGKEMSALKRQLMNHS